MLRLASKYIIALIMVTVIGLTSTLSLKAQSTNSGLVLGTSTVVSSPVSSPRPAAVPADATNGNVAAAETQANTSPTSPLTIICIVAGGILIIALIFFLFFRKSGDSTEESLK
mgnify:CR=1 FL=1